MCRSTACDSRQTAGRGRVGVRGHSQARLGHHIQTRQADGGREYLWLLNGLLAFSVVLSFSLPLLPPAVRHEELRPEPGRLHLTGGL